MERNELVFQSDIYRQKIDNGENVSPKHMSTFLALVACALRYPETTPTTEALVVQILRLAAFISRELPGEPRVDEPVVDTAIRIIRNSIDKTASACDAWQARAEKAEADLAVVEAMRPHWAQGYTSDSVAAQVTTCALNKLWSLLGVTDQTQAVDALKAVLASDRSHRAESVAMDRIALADIIEGQAPWWSSPSLTPDQWAVVIAALRTSDPARPSVEAVDDAMVERARQAWLTATHEPHPAGTASYGGMRAALEAARIVPTEIPARQPEAKGDSRLIEWDAMVERALDSMYPAGWRGRGQQRAWNDMQRALRASCGHPIDVEVLKAEVRTLSVRAEKAEDALADNGIALVNDIEKLRKSMSPPMSSDDALYTRGYNDACTDIAVLRIRG